MKLIKRIQENKELFAGIRDRLEPLYLENYPYEVVNEFTSRIKRQHIQGEEASLW